MRPVTKGVAPRLYKTYGEARHDLAERIGYYCSFCEMKVFQSIEVEHILPQAKGGAVVDWDNFLLSCKYCNTIKSDNNANIVDYFWPDRDNTDLAFRYDEADVITPDATLSDILTAKAKATIKLMGLDRRPSGPEVPTEADTRWRSQKEAWDTAKLSFINWTEAPIAQMAKQIAATALNGGQYSIWMKVFEGESDVTTEIDKAYEAKNLRKKFDANGVRIVLANALI